MRMAEGAITLLYDNVIYGDTTTNPEKWETLQYHANGLLPDYGPQNFIGGGLGSDGVLLSMWDVNDDATYKIMQTGTYNFSVATKIDGKAIVVKTSRRYVLKIMCDTPDKTGLKLAEEDAIYHWPWSTTCLNCFANGVHLPAGSRVWTEFTTRYEPNIGREDSRIFFVPDGSYFKCHLVN